jgi:hypothetical protein
MSYNELPSVSTGDLWTAAQHNTFLKDNLADHEARVLALEAGGADVPTLVTKRQGGSETAWATVGNTDYTPDPASIKRYKGVKRISLASQSTNTAVVTFPNAFTYPPHVLVCANVFFIYAAIVVAPTASQVTLSVYYLPGGNATGDYDIYWEAEGI